MQFARYVAMSASISLGVILLSGCSQGNGLDQIQTHLDEWGTITMSSPLLTADDERFDFDLKQTAEEYYAAAGSVEAAAASYDTRYHIFSAAGQVEWMPLKMAEYRDKLDVYEQDRFRDQRYIDEWDAGALAQYKKDVDEAEKETDKEKKQKMLKEANDRLNKAKADAPARTASRPSAPDLTMSSTNRAKKDDYQTTQPAAVRSLLPSSTQPYLSSRTRLAIAAGDKMSQGMYGVLSDPHSAQKFEDRRTIYAVTLVSVNPGWRTQKGYAADLSVLVEYGFIPARKHVVEEFSQSQELTGELATAVTNARNRLNTVPLKANQPIVLKERDGMPVPAVLAIAPLTETQVQDLSNSVREQFERVLALQVLAQMPQGSVNADTYDRLVKTHQADVWTRTAAVCANTSSGLHGLFGCQVGPKLRANEDPGKGRFNPSNVLDRQSFPMLVAIRVMEDDLRPKVIKRDKELDIYEPCLVFKHFVRWVPLENRRGASHASAIAEVKAVLAKTGTKKSDASSQSWISLSDVQTEGLWDKGAEGKIEEARRHILFEEAVGGVNWEYIPPEKSSRVDKVPCVQLTAKPREENKGNKNYPYKMVVEVRGAGLKHIDGDKATVLDFTGGAAECHGFAPGGKKEEVYKLQVLLKENCKSVSLSLPFRIESPTDPKMELISGWLETEAVRVKLLTAASAPASQTSKPSSQTSKPATETSK